jgi:xanthine/uracil permease
MLSKIKRVFFPAIFGALYLCFAVQLVSVAVGYFSGGYSQMPLEFGMLIFEWLALITARYLSGRSASGASAHNAGGGGPRRNHFRR